MEEPTRERIDINFLREVESMAERGRVKDIEAIGRKAISPFINEVMRAAAKAGKIEVMILLKLWGATDTYRAFSSAAAGGNINAIRLTMTWDTRLNYNHGLYMAACGGHLAAMKFFSDYGARDYTSALAGAAMLGQVEAMERLLKAGATGINKALSTAAACSVATNRAAAMDLLIKTEKVTDYNKPLIVAAKYGHVDAMDMLLKNGASNVNEALIEAAKNKRVSAMFLAKKWGAMDYAEAYTALAAEPETRGRDDVLKLILPWIINSSES